VRYPLRSGPLAGSRGSLGGDLLVHYGPMMADLPGRVGSIRRQSLARRVERSGLFRSVSLTGLVVLAALANGCSGDDDASDGTPSAGKGGSATGGSAGTSGGSGTGGASGKGGGAGTGGGGRGGSSGDSGASGADQGGGTGATGGRGGSGGSTVDPTPGDPGCGLDSAAFCDTFDTPAKARGRAGDADVTKWSASRMAPQGPTAYGQAYAVRASTLRPFNDAGGARKQLAACRSGVSDEVLPDEDILVCDPSEDVASRHLLVAVGSQNYGQNTLRARQPFDFEGRTGKIVFDVEALAGGLLGWVSLAVTEDPVGAPSFQTEHNSEGGVLPRNGFSVQLNEPCNGMEGTNFSLNELHVFDDYVETILKPTDRVCLPTQWGKLNHIEISVAQNRIEVYGTPFSEDGTSFEPVKLIWGGAVDLPFTRGYVQLTTHNHATLKYTEAGSDFKQGFADLDAWIARWDNVGFDGPSVRGLREYEVPDSLDEFHVMGNDVNYEGVNTGWTLADQADSPKQTLHFTDVDLDGMKSARLAYDAWYCAGCGPPVGAYGVKYRFNGNAWHERQLTVAEAMSILPEQGQGAVGHVVDVPLDELVAGDNAVEFVSMNHPTNYPVGLVNVDLVLSE
jgi:hypothetical protein